MRRASAAWAASPARSSTSRSTEGARAAFGGEQDPEGVVADDERHPEDAAELLAQRGRSVPSPWGKPVSSR